MAHHHHEQKSGTWTERTMRPAAMQELANVGPGDGMTDTPLPKMSFQHSHTSLGGGSYGVAAHLLRMAGVFIPVLAGELVQDATKYKKTVRLASIGTAIGFELLHLLQEQERAKKQAEKLAEC